MGYYGITFGMADLSDDLFTNYIVSSVLGRRTKLSQKFDQMFAEVPAYIMVLLVMDIIGRKTLFSISLLFTGISCIICGFLATVWI